MTARSVERTLALSWMAVALAASLAADARPAWIEALAASPDRIREGKLWFLVSSAALVDRPIAASLVFFFLLGLLAFTVCGGSRFWLSAFYGQVAATLAVYAFIAVARALVPGAFQAALASPDYGVSTISAAWLGTVAAVSWRRRGRGFLQRCSIALSCLAVGMFAYTMRPDVTVLSSEHLVAFALGIAAASPRAVPRALAALPPALRLLRARLAAATGNRLEPAHATLLLLAAVGCAVAVAPAGLAALRHDIAAHLPATPGRCAAEWNRSPIERSAGRIDQVGGLPISVASITTWKRLPSDRGRRVGPTYCRYVFPGAAGSAVVLGRWHRGRVIGWSAVRPLRDSPMRPNALVQLDGRVRLVAYDPGQVTLTS